MADYTNDPRVEVLAGSVWDMSYAQLLAALDAVDPARQWRDVVGYEGRYEVSAMGHVRKKTGEPVGQWRKNGYMQVRLSGPRALLRVHRLVAEAFVPNPEGYPVVNHLNHNPHDNRAVNLEWCTQGDNLRHATEAGRMPRDYWRGKRSPTAILTDKEVIELREIYANGGVSLAELAARYGMSKKAVWRCVRGFTYCDLPLPAPPEAT